MYFLDKRIFYCDTMCKCDDAQQLSQLLVCVYPGKYTKRLPDKAGTKEERGTCAECGCSGTSSTPRNTKLL